MQAGRNITTLTAGARLSITLHVQLDAGTWNGERVK
jgi:hypothetical protein